MVEFYFKLVKAGKLALEDVPTKYREKVKELINGEG